MAVLRAAPVADTHLVLQIGRYMSSWEPIHLEISIISSKNYDKQVEETVEHVQTMVFWVAIIYSCACIHSNTVSVFRVKLIMLSM
jgi:hypothetical protein